MEGITVSIYWMDLLASAHQGVLPGEPDLKIPKTWDFPKR
jgi:hypothetical protein